MWRATTWQAGLAVGLFVATSQWGWAQSAFMRPTGPVSGPGSVAASRSSNGIYAPNATYVANSNAVAPATGLQPQPAISGATSVGAPCNQYAGSGSSTYAGNVHGGLCHRVGGCLFDDHADMPQHHPYYPPMHGYYYFHPYHHAHVDAQRDFAGQWGMDPRNPYANDIFKMVYAEVRASQDESVERVPTPPVTAPKRRPYTPMSR